MKQLFVGLILILFFSCKSSSQAILIKSDGGLISEKDLMKSSLRVTPPLVAKMNNDTINLSIDLTGIGGGSVDNGNSTTYPNFQKITVLTEGQTFFPFIIPKIYIVFKNRVLMDNLSDYVVSNGGLTFVVPSKIGDIVKVINMQPK